MAASVALATIAAALTAWTREANLVVPSATDELLRHVKFLSAAELTGRGVDTPGIKLARDYIAAEFAKSGLKPGGDNGSFLQSFDVAVGVSVTGPSSLALGSNRRPGIEYPMDPVRFIDLRQSPSPNGFRRLRHHGERIRIR